MSMKNSSDTIRKRTSDFPAGGAVSEPTAPPRAPRVSYDKLTCTVYKVKAICCFPI
jgi:hypothetical protein